MKKLTFVAFVFIFICCSVNKHNPRVKVATDVGEFELEIFVDKAPITANNFLKYVDSSKYNGNACFYRTVRMDNQPNNPIKIEVVQGGFYDDSLIEKYQFAPIKHESTIQTGIKHNDGIISMARMEPGTASSEFFICIDNQPELDFGGKRNPDGQGFAAFGKVINGMDVVRKIQQMKDTNQYLISPVKIIRVERLKN